MRLVFLLLAALTCAAQSSVTLNGVMYTTTAHPRVWMDGPSGALSVAMQDATNRAQSSNPAYAALVSKVNAAIAENLCTTGTNAYSGVNCAGAINQYEGDSMAIIADAAVLWWAQGANVTDPNGYLAFAKNGYLNLQDFWNGSAVCQYTTVNTSGTAVTWVSGTQFSSAWATASPYINGTPFYSGVASVNSATSITLTTSAGTQTGVTFLVNYCGRNNTNDFNDIAWDSEAWLGYSIIRSQLSGGQITTISNEVLNDNDTSHNGLNATACTPQSFTLGGGTSISYSTSTNVVTGTGTTFTSTLAVGDVLFTGGLSSIEIGIVYSISSDTSLLLTTKAQTTNSTDTTWQYVVPWTSSNCGYIWLAKHAEFASPIIPAQASSYTTNYPPSAGTFIPLDQNLVNSQLEMYITLGLALADDDSRAGSLLTQSYNYWYANCYPLFKTGWGGWNQSQQSYDGVWHVDVLQIPLVVRNSIQSGPNLTPGYWISRYVPYIYYDAIPPWASSFWAAWGDQYPQNAATSLTEMRGPLQACYESAGPTGTLSTECSAMYNYLRSVRTDYTTAGWGVNGGSYLAGLYLFYNYNASSTAAVQTQYAFKDWDWTYAQCVSNFSADACVNGQQWGAIISKSDWTATGTHMLIKAGWDKAGQDHTQDAQQGAFHIYRGAIPLLAGDNVGAPTSNGANGTYNGCNGVQDSMVDLNCTNITNGSVATMARWASTDPTGDSSSRYAYAMIDQTAMFTASGHATRVQRHIAHFKKATYQDYIVVYDDVALSSALAVAPKAYFHYFLNAVAPGTAITYNGSGMAISNLQTSGAALLNSFFLPVEGGNTAALVVDNANGTYTGGNGYTFRSYMCPSSNGSTCNASATTGEWLGIFQPINGTSGSMPTLTQPAVTATGGNAAAVQVADASYPKVAVFARQGATLTAMTFTSTFSGTGQYLITGMTPGHNYAVTIGGTSASGSPFPVASGDTSIYFEGAAGAISISQASATAGTGIYGPIEIFGPGSIQ